MSTFVRSASFIFISPPLVSFLDLFAEVRDKQVSFLAYGIHVERSISMGVEVRWQAADSQRLQQTRIVVKLASDEPV